MRDKQSKNNMCKSVMLKGDSIKSFIKGFISLSGIREVVVTKVDNSGYLEIYKEYINDIKRLLMQIPLGKYQFLEGKESKVYLHIILFIQQVIHAHVLPLLPLEEDTKFHNKCKAIQELKAEVFDVKEDNLDIQLEELAISKLNLLDTFHSAQEKLEGYLEVHIMIGNRIAMWNGKEAGADDILPVLIYLIIKTAPRMMITTLK